MRLRCNFHHSSHHYILIFICSFGIYVYLYRSLNRMLISILINVTHLDYMMNNYIFFK